MNSNKIKIIVLFILLGIQTVAISGPRFPMPEFESGHTQPPTLQPEPRSDFFEIFDAFVLIAALTVITWLIHKKRSRRGVFWVSIFSLLYFGFIREGCICSIGAIQNITLALFNPSYQIPATVIAFFVIPLIYTLFYGRTFCAGVCPLGAIQDIFALQPVDLKTWVQKILGLIPFIYLGLAILYAATSTDFIICRYDPFVGIFRLDATFFMFSIGALFIITSVFIARPYCRFFCPYGVLLNLISRVSKKHVEITPTHCINCRLCENSCPFGAIEKPVPVKEIGNKNTALRKFMTLSFIIPLLIFIGGWTGSQFHENLAMVNADVRLANEILTTDLQDKTIEFSEEIKAFKSSGKTADEIYAKANEILDDFYIGGWILGGFIGLVFGITLASVSIFRYREDYKTNKGECFSCARCFDYCPVKVES
ncbi:MAG: 4Fe-4S binding protein [Bacteroidales bacterium]|nr:4Fe-4S binding protein [Bacteroidales bacterium]